MTVWEKPFEADKSFGLSVLLKLTKANVRGIEIHDTGGKLTSNVGMGTLSDAVGKTMKTHNISLKVK